VSCLIVFLVIKIFLFVFRRSRRLNAHTNIQPRIVKMGILGEREGEMRGVSGLAGKIS
jgi:positive regulator of sigma E activity